MVDKATPPEGYVTDYISGRRVKATPEEMEAVQVFSRRLVEEYGYSKEQIQTRPQFRIKASPSGEEKYPVDIAVFRDENKFYENLYVIVECKRRKNRKEGENQLKRYMGLSAAQIGVWFNGKDHLYLQKILDAQGDVTYRELPNIPKKGESIENVGKFRRRDLKPAANLKAIFRDLRNHVVGMTTGITQTASMSRKADIWTKAERLISGLSPATQRAYKATWRRFRDFLDGREPTPQLAYDFVASLKRRYASKSVDLYAAAVRYLFEHVLEQPLAKKALPAIRPRRRLVRVLSGAEISQVERVLQTDEERALFHLLYDAALREGEALRLRARHVRPEGYLRVLGKGGKWREVMLDPGPFEAVQALARQRKPDQYVLWSARGQKSYTHGWVWLKLQDLARRAGLAEGFSAQALRRTRATEQWRSTKDPLMVRDLLGHVSVGTTEQSIVIGAEDQRVPNRHAKGKP